MSKDLELLLARAVKLNGGGDAAPAEKVAPVVAADQVEVPPTAVAMTLDDALAEIAELKQQMELLAASTPPGVDPAVDLEAEGAVDDGSIDDDDGTPADDDDPSAGFDFGDDFTTPTPDEGKAAGLACPECGGTEADDNTAAGVVCAVDGTALVTAETKGFDFDGLGGFDFDGSDFDLETVPEEKADLVVVETKAVAMVEGLSEFELLRTRRLDLG